MARRELGSPLRRHARRVAQGLRRLWIRLRLPTMIRVVKWTVGALLLIGLYLSVVGFPDSMTRSIEETLLDEGYHVRLQSLYLHPVEGIVARRAQLFLDVDDRYPTLEAEEVVLGFDVRAWLQRETGLRRVRLRNATARLSTQGALTEAEGADALRLEKIDADVRWAEDLIHVSRVEADLYGMALIARGELQLDPEARPRDAVEDEPHRGMRVADFSARHETWLQAIAEEMETLSFAVPPSIELEFSLDLADSSRDVLQLVAAGKAMRLRGLPFDGWRLRAQLIEGEFDLQEGMLYSGNQRLEGTMQYDLETEMVKAWLYSDLDPLFLRNLIPDPLREQLERARVHWSGATELEMTAGPSPLEEFGEHLSGRVSVGQMDAHGVWIESLESSVIRSGHRIHLPDMDAVIGRDAQQGRARGEATYELDQNTYHGAVKTSFDPHAVLPVAGYSTHAAFVIRSTAFEETLPSVDVIFSGSVEPEPLFHFEGTMSATDFVYQGSRIKEFGAQFHLADRVMRIDPLFVEREEGTLEGGLQLDFKKGIMDIDVDSQVDPMALARLPRGDTMERILRPFRFEGAIDVHLNGRIDYRNHQATDYVATGWAENVGWRWLLADRCEMEWIAKGNRITMSNLRLNLYGGYVDGTVQLDGVGDDEVRYTAEGDVADMKFSALLKGLRQTEEPLEEEGDLSGRFHIAGVAEDDWKNSAQGEGRIRIRDGQVFQIPLFGGLSELLGRIYPRLGKAVQTDVRATFQLGDRRLSSDDIRLEGNILSLRGAGYYHLDDALQFKVQVQPLRRGFLVDVVRVVTYPVSRLLQFNLQGDLGNPRWTIDALPRDLLRVFEEEVESHE